jgi:hypothetical protein
MEDEDNGTRAKKPRFHAGLPAPTPQPSPQAGAAHNPGKRSREEDTTAERIIPQAKKIRTECGLPVGWEKRVDKASGMVYWADHINHSTSWTSPQDFPPPPSPPQQPSHTTVLVSPSVTKKPTAAPVPRHRPQASPVSVPGPPQPSGPLKQSASQPPPARENETVYTWYVTYDSAKGYQCGGAFAGATPGKLARFLNVDANLATYSAKGFVSQADIGLKLPITGYYGHTSIEDGLRLENAARAKASEVIDNFEIYRELVQAGAHAGGVGVNTVKGLDVLNQEAAGRSTHASNNGMQSPNPLPADVGGPKSVVDLDTNNSPANEHTAGDDGEALVDTYVEEKDPLAAIPNDEDVPVPNQAVERGPIDQGTETAPTPVEEEGDPINVPQPQTEAQKETQKDIPKPVLKRDADLFDEALAELEAEWEAEQAKAKEEAFLDQPDDSRIPTFSEFEQWVEESYDPLAELNADIAAREGAAGGVDGGLD